MGPSILKAVSTYGKDFSSGHAGSVFLEEPASKSIRWMRADSWEGPVFGPIWEKGMKARDMIAALPPTLLGRGGGRISELGQLHESAWEEVEKPVAGYIYRAEVFVRGTSIIALLDTGASTNAIPEELVVALINGAIGDGLTPQNENWPVRLERWKGSETVTGVARGQDLTIVGAAVMPILFRGQDGREKTQKMRFKIFGKGCSGWMGVIIGGLSLEPIPLGLGLKTTPSGHHLSSKCLTAWTSSTP